MTTATTPPESGDKAKETTFTVSQVRSLPTGAILHMGFFPSSSPFTPPTHLRQAINIPLLRTLHSRLHTAGHVIGLAVNTLIQRGDLPNTIADSKASHYPNAAYVTFTQAPSRPPWHLPSNPPSTKWSRRTSLSASSSGMKTGRGASATVLAMGPS
ncbi:alanyl-trna synthetase [Pyrenophora tritici-repentis]|nr:alanyl-trna synthetase [Pyrenophora tritici-repentis]